MKKEPRICRNCKYHEIRNRGEIYDHEDYIYCDYWKSRVGKIVETYGCEKFEPNLHDHNAAPKP